MNLETFRSHFAHLAVPMTIATSEAKLVEVNEAFCRYIGYSREELLKLSILDYTHSDDLDRTRSFFRQVAKREIDQFHYEKRYIRKDGTEVWAVVTTTWGQAEDGGEPLCIAVIQDISARVAAEQACRKATEELRRSHDEYNYVAYYDQLTDLPNRTLFYDRIMHGIERSRRSVEGMAVVIFHLDRFRNINKSLGYTGGDQVIKAVADRLKTRLRSSDSLSRISGTAFGMMIEKTQGLQTSAKVAERILSAFGALFAVQGHELHLTPSIGISHYPEDGENVESLLHAAESARIKASERGGNGYEYYQPKMGAEAKRFLELESLLHSALEKDQFEAYFQPQVDPSSGRIVGLEALARWNHPERGLVSPAEFIPVAEETGFIVPLGERILEIACRQAEKWLPHLPLNLRISVNISALQIVRSDLGQVVKDVLMRTGLPPSHLEIEITESALMGSPQRALDALKTIKGMGVRVALDDFGTGYSAMSYLRSFPIDRIKIDRSFIGNLHGGIHELPIVETIFDLGRRLGLEVVAEGVETIAQLETLLGMGCATVQGFYFSRPQTAETVTRNLEEWFGPNACPFLM